MIEPVLNAKKQDIKPPLDSLGKYSIQTCKLFQLWDKLQLIDGILFRVFYDSQSDAKWKQLVVPSSLQSEILEQVHAGSVGGHLGQSKTLQKLKDRFYWPGHYNDVMRWCSLCSSCVTRKQRPHFSLFR